MVRSQLMKLHSASADIYDRDDLWWQSGNIVEVIAKFGLEDESFRPTAVQIISNTYNKSPNQHGADAWSK